MGPFGCTQMTVCAKNVANLFEISKENTYMTKPEFELDTCSLTCTIIREFNRAIKPCIDNGYMYI